MKKLVNTTLRNTKRLLLSNKKKLLFGLAMFLGLFFVINLALYFTFANKTYNKTFLNQQDISNLKDEQLQQKINEIITEPQSIKLVANNKSKDVEFSELSVTLNKQAILKNIKSNRSFVPIFNLLKTKNNHGSFDLTDENKLKNLLLNAAKELDNQPQKQAIIKSEQSFELSSPRDGSVIDIDKSANLLIENLNTNNHEIGLALNKQSPAKSTIDLNKEKETLNTAISQQIVIDNKGVPIKISKQQLISVYTPQDETFIVSDQEINRLVSQIISDLGVEITNSSEVAKKIKQSLQDKQATKIALAVADRPAKRYSYCVAVKGVSESEIAGFATKLASVYADNRGWNLGGSTSFSKVSSGCNFTAWLTRADLVPSFNSTICDSTWSCRIGNNVIINFDRWVGASPAWNGAGGSLDEYRSMVINHETGHWLGFSHRYCGGANQAAPVMQQQSINLQGCKFNAWPTESEKSSL